MKHSGIFIRTKRWNKIKASNIFFYLKALLVSKKSKLCKGDILVLLARNITKIFIVSLFLLLKKNEWSDHLLTQVKQFWNLPKFEKNVRDESNLGIITNILH